MKKNISHKLFILFTLLTYSGFLSAMQNPQTNENSKVNFCCAIRTDKTEAVESFVNKNTLNNEELNQAFELALKHNSMNVILFFLALKPALIDHVEFIKRKDLHMLATWIKDYVQNGTSFLDYFNATKLDYALWTGNEKNILNLFLFEPTLIADIGYTHLFLPVHKKITDFISWLKDLNQYYKDNSKRKQPFKYSPKYLVYLGKSFHLTKESIELLPILIQKFEDYYFKPQEIAFTTENKKEELKENLKEDEDLFKKMMEYCNKN